MKINKKKLLILIVAIGLILLPFVIIWVRGFLLDVGYIHYSKKEIIAIYESKKKDLETVAQYVISQCEFYDENTDKSNLVREFEDGELLSYITILRTREENYAEWEYTTNTTDGLGEKVRETEPYLVPENVEKSLNKLIYHVKYSNQFVYVDADETDQNSTFVTFSLRSSGILDRQYIIKFKDKEHDFDFFYDYKVVPLSDEGWYYIYLGEV